MRFVLFCHSLISDWNHGNAHFLRGIVTELLARGHEVRVFEPADAWSVRNLIADAGAEAIDAFHRAYPHLSSMRVIPDQLDLDTALHGADVVLVHEWNDHPLVKRIGQHRARSGGYVLFFHDTHHRSLTDESAMAGYDLQHFDGVLAFGDVIRERYLKRGWARRAFTWHEAADTRVFAPMSVEKLWDAVWIGNWGDDERSEEIRQFLLQPVRQMRLRARVHGVRYPDAAVRELAEAGIEFAGWLPNYRVPEVFARARATLHVPRRPYVERLPGVPTIRVFEALACGIPLVSCWWHDCEHLFTPGEDFLMVKSPDEMALALNEVLSDPERASALATHGVSTIHSRHTCAHRVDELLAILSGVGAKAAAEEAVRA